jgi:pSer/pThr/pTyr-binding forkhead associated (FHA) protein
MPYLIQKKPDGTMVQQWQLGDKTLVVGRGKNVDVRIEDAEMSKRHFQIEYKNGGYFLRDLNSINGTWIDKIPITEIVLTPGDRIRAGQTQFAFEKGLGTVIGELAQENRGYETVLKEITKDLDKLKRRR